MTDKRIKMNCPFCGTSYKKIELISYPITGKPKFVLIKCPKCNVQFTGISIQETIDKWNRRV